MHEFFLFLSIPGLSVATQMPLCERAIIVACCLNIYFFPLPVTLGYYTSVILVV